MRRDQVRVQYRTRLHRRLPPPGLQEGGEAATFFGVPEDDFTLTSGKPKAFHYVAQSGKELDRNFCLDCGARVFTGKEGFPGTIFVTLVAWIILRASSLCLRKFTKRRLTWAKPLDAPQ